MNSPSPVPGRVREIEHSHNGQQVRLHAFNVPGYPNEPIPGLGWAYWINPAPDHAENEPIGPFHDLELALNVAADYFAWPQPIAGGDCDRVLEPAHG